MSAVLEPRHPQATHTVRLGSVDVAYLLVSSSRRTIGLEVGPQGLTVRAPLRASLAQVEAVLQDKSRWVLSKLSARAQREQRQPSVHWQQHAVLPYLGGVLKLELHPAAPRGGYLLCVSQGKWVLHLPLPPDSVGAAVRAAVVAWWLRHARELLTQRLQRFAPMVGVQWRSLRLANPRTRWGSAKTDGSIMLNWRLLHHRLEVIDYVVVHELSHLQVMDHSPRFWTVVAQTCPDYVHLRAQLRELPVPDWEI